MHIHTHTTAQRARAPSARSHRAANARGKLGAYVLPPELLLHDGIRHIPPGHPLRELRRLRRVVAHGLGALPAWGIKPEEALHLPVRPEHMRHAAHERERRAARARLPVRDDLLHEALVLRRLAVVERRVLDDLPAREPHERLRPEQPAREVVVDFVRKAVREDFLQVRGDVRRRGVVRVVRRGVPVRRGRERERERQDGALRREDERVPDHRARARVVFGVLQRLDRGVLGVRQHRGVSCFVVLDDVDGCLERLLVHRRRERRGVLGADEDADVEKLFLGDLQFLQEAALGSELERRVRRGEVERRDELVDARIQQGISRPEDRVDI